jgi:hypothetical protein
MPAKDKQTGTKKSNIQSGCDRAQTARMTNTMPSKSTGNKTPSSNFLPNKTDNSHWLVARRTPQTTSHANAMQAKNKTSSSKASWEFMRDHQRIGSCIMIGAEVKVKPFDIFQTLAKTRK